MNDSISRRDALPMIGALPLLAAGCHSSTESGGSGKPHRHHGAHAPMTSERSVFGTLPDGREAHRFTFRNPNGTTLKFTNYGLLVTELHTKDRQGKLGNVVLGFETLGRYLEGHPFFGCIAGRFANRIAKGRFTLDGKEYVLAVNNGPNHLHGGWWASTRSSGRLGRCARPRTRSRWTCHTPARRVKKGIPAR